MYIQNTYKTRTIFATSQEFLQHSPIELPEVQVCDARNDDSSTEGGYIKKPSVETPGSNYAEPTNGVVTACMNMKTAMRTIIPILPYLLPILSVLPYLLPVLTAQGNYNMVLYHFLFF
jgi:hypothetical protein